MARRPPRSTLFPYTTLFRSEQRALPHQFEDLLLDLNLLLARSAQRPEEATFGTLCGARDRKSTRLNSSHTVISYAVFCLKKKKQAGRRPGRPSPGPPRRPTA